MQIDSSDMNPLTACSHDQMRVYSLLWWEYMTYKLSSRFAQCGLDADDILDRSSWVMWAISVSSCRLRASETQQLADSTSVCYLCGVARGQPSTNDGPTCNTS